MRVIRIFLMFMCLHGISMQAFSLPLTEHQQLCAERLHEKVNGDLLNAWRVINHLWRLPLEEFTHSWTALISLYLDHYDELINERCAHRFVNQCRNIHQFFGGLLCNPIMQVLAYHPYGMEVVPAHELFVPIISYWHEISLESYRLFYLLYFDVLSYIFVHSVYGAAADIENYHNDMNVNKLDLLYAELKIVHTHLMGSIYERRYARQLARYEQIIALLFTQRSKYLEQKESDV